MQSSNGAMRATVIPLLPATRRIYKTDWSDRLIELMTPKSLKSPIACCLPLIRILQSTKTMSDSTDQPRSHWLSMCVVRRRRLSLPDVTPLVSSTETSLTDGGCHTAAPRGVSMPYLSPPTFQSPSSVIIGPVPSRLRKPHHSPQRHSLFPFQVNVGPHSQGPVPYDAYPLSPPSPSDRFIRRPRGSASVPPPSLHTPNAVVLYHSQRAAEMRAIVEGRKRHMERQYRLRVREQMEEEAQAQGRDGARRRMVPVLPVVRHFMGTMLVPDSPKSTSSNPPDSDRETRRRIKMMPPQLEYLGKLWGKVSLPSSESAKDLMLMPSRLASPALPNVKSRAGTSDSPLVKSKSGSR